MAVLWSWSLFGINIALCWIHSNMSLSIVLHSSMLYFTCQFLNIQWGKINLSVDHPYPAFIETPHILDIPTAQYMQLSTVAEDWDFCFLTINECSNKLTMVQLLNHLSHFRTLQQNIMKVCNSLYLIQMTATILNTFPFWHTEISAGITVTWWVGFGTSSQTLFVTTWGALSHQTSIYTAWVTTLHVTHWQKKMH